MRPRLLAALVALTLALGMTPSTGLSAKSEAQKARPKSLFADLIPPAPFLIVVKQPDGSTFKARLTPAEIGGNLETPEGYAVVEGAGGWWYYADRAEGAKLFPSKQRVGLGSPKGLPVQLGRTPSIWSGEAGRLRNETFRALQVASFKAQTQAAATGNLPYVFKTPFLMIATWYDKEKGQTVPQFQEGHDKEFFNKLLNGFGGNPTGTMTEFWLENSYGQFLVQVDVLGPYTSARSIPDPCYYGNVEPENQFIAGEDTGLPRIDDLDPAGNALGIGGVGAVGMAVEAVPQADVDVDFGQYDNDKDGKVDFVGLIHSGADMAATGNPCHTWSHAFEVTFAAGLVPGLGPVIAERGGLPTNDVNESGMPVVVDRVFTMPEIGAEIGVAVHEMMHARGEPDYYNTSYTSSGTGDWDIMAGGSWFGNPPGSNPMGANPATKVFQGWVTPKVVHSDMRAVALKPREVVPMPGYSADKVNPNLILVPTDWTDSTAEADIYGLPKDPTNGKYVTQGWYIENISRSVTAAPLHKGMSRSPYFDRVALSSGLMIWHFDYFRKSNVYFGANNGQSDPNRPQMDPEEFDYNDNSQELQLNYTRGEPSDLWFGAATGMTTATRRNPPGIPTGGTPQAAIEGTGVNAPTGKTDYPFTVAPNPANYEMKATLTSSGDCTLGVGRKDANGEYKQVAGIDAGGAGDTETLVIYQPDPGEWILRVGDFAGCTDHAYGVKFALPFFTMGAADTWTNEGKPTGWAFTNIGPGSVDELEHSADAPGPEAITLDILNLGKSEVDVSPGFVKPAETKTFGRAPVNAGAPSALEVAVFNNGGETAKNVTVAVHLGSPSGPVVASKSIPVLAGYTQDVARFTWTPQQEGKLDLYTVVDTAGIIAEAHEGNNVQKSDLVVGPANPRVLVVDDEGSNEFHESYLGALTALGVPYAYSTGHVTAEDMRRYDAVIWEAGLDRYQGQLNKLDRAEIKKYLDGGGKFWMSSIRLAAAMGEAPGRTNPGSDESMPAMLRDYFGAILMDTLQVGGGTVTGTGDASGIGGDAGYRLDIAPGRPLQDQWKVAEGDDASKVGTAHKLLEWSKGGQQGVRVVGDTAHKGFKAVYFGFNLTQVISGADQVALTRQVMQYFGVPLGTYKPSVPLLFHSSPRARRSGEVTHLVAYSFGGAPTVRYRAHMRGAFGSMPMKALSPAGVYQATLPGPWATPLGIDYYLQGSVSDPAGSPKLAHYIGVTPPDRAPPGAVAAVKGAKRSRSSNLPATGVEDGVLGIVMLAFALALGSRIRRRPV